MMTAAASALLLGAAACSNDEDVRMGDTNYGAETEQTAGTADVDTDAMDDTRMAETETVYLTSGDLSAGELIGAEVMGADGEKIATVDDLLINADGRIETVVFRSGDFVDLVGTKGALAYDQLDLTMAGDGDPRFSVAMTEDALQQVAEFQQDGLNDYRLASEMIGTTADFMNSDESARINDIIVSEAGEARYAIVGDPAMMNDERQLAFNLISVEQDDGGAIVIDAAPEDYETMPVFKYEEDSRMDSNRKSMNDWDEESDTDASDVMMEDDR
jgi:hypothetical protein